MQTKNVRFLDSYVKSGILSVFLLLSFLAHGQNRVSRSNLYLNLERYTKAIMPSEYSAQFKDNDDRKNFKKLREFLWEKDELSAGLANERLRYNIDPRTIKAYKDKITELNSIIDGKKDAELVEVDRNIIFIDLYGYYDSISPVKERRNVSYIKSAKDRYVNDLSVFDDQFKIVSILDSNINNVKDDIRAVYKQIDSTLAPEYKQQDFRTNISLYFTILIGILLTAFFIIVYKKSDKNLSKELLGGNGLQFVTLFVLIIAVILFGILSILQSSELAAILSGISGYILGKGTQKDGGGTTVINNPAQ